MRNVLPSLAMISMCVAMPANAAVQGVDLITEIDVLGYECIDEVHFIETSDAAATAFALGGKIRLPRICHTDPCDVALTQRELSNLTGTDRRIPRFMQEWDDYYARYADYCRKETTPDPEKVAQDDRDFWERTRRPAQIADSLRAGSPVLPATYTSPAGRTSAPIVPLGFTPIPSVSTFANPTLATTQSGSEVVATPDIGTADFGEVLGTTDTIATLSEVPLPSTLGLLALGLLGLRMLRRA